MDVVKFLGEKKPSELGMRVTRGTQRPVLPPTVDNTVVVPGMHGAWDFGAYMGPRPLSLECEFGTRNSFELQRRVNALATYLLDPNGRPRTMPIIFENQPTRQIMARYSGEMPIERIVGLGRFILPMIAYDPFAYSIESTSDLLTWDTDYTWEDDFSWSDSYSYSVTGPSTIKINNFGILNVEPVITVTGSFSTLSLTIGGVEFIYSTPLGGELVLDFKRKTARVGAMNVLQNTNARFGKLPPGISNVTVSGTGLNATIDIIFNAKYPA